MFMFGFLKFFNPFKQWYSVQISGSGLGNAAYVMGIAGEMIVGATFVYTLVRWHALTNKQTSMLLTIASALVIIIMITGVYVHLQPAVPAEVLPLKIKPPYIPTLFMLLALGNIWSVRIQQLKV